MKTINKIIILVLVFFVSINSYSQTSAINTVAIPKWKLADLQDAIDKSDKPTIFNFWATFCKPCIEEIPYFQEEVKKYEKEGVQLVLVSLDMPELYPKKIQSFVNRFKFTADVVYLDETNADLFCPIVDPKWSGSIPASLFINRETGYRSFFEDQLSRKQLTDEIEKMIFKK